MKLKKYLTSIILIFISMLTFFGCASIQYVRIVNPDNSVIDSLVIELDESKIDKSLTDLESIKIAINDDLIHFRQEVNEWKHQFEVYPEIYLTMEKGIEVKHSIENNRVVLNIIFSDWNMFGLFYGYKTVENMEYKKALVDKGPFIDQILSENHENETLGIFLIKYSMLKNNGIIDDIENFEFDGINYYEKYINLTNNRYSLQDVNVSQVFTFPDDRIYGNADEKLVEGGITILQWNLSDKPEDFQMEIYKLAPDTIPWYILALIISAIVIIVLFVIIIFKNKNKVQEKTTRWDVEKNG